MLLINFPSYVRLICLLVWTTPSDMRCGAVDCNGMMHDKHSLPNCKVKIKMKAPWMQKVAKLRSTFWKGLVFLLVLVGIVLLFLWLIFTLLTVAVDFEVTSYESAVAVPILERPGLNGVNNINNESVIPEEALKSLVMRVQAASSLRISLNTTAISNADMILRGFALPRPLVGINPNSSWQNLSFDAHVIYTGKDRITREVVMIDGRRAYQWTGGPQPIGRCLNPTEVPPLQSITDVRAMQPQWIQLNLIVHSVFVDMMPLCTSEESLALQVTFAGEPYVICWNNHNSLIHVHGEDLLLDLVLDTLQPQEIDQRREEIQLRRPLVEKCPLLNVDHSQERAWTNQTVPTWTHETLSTVLEKQKCGQDCPCRMANRRNKRKPHCLFVHGLGVKEERGLRDNFTAYWGDIKSKVPCCQVSKFVHLNTVDTPWYASDLAVKICNAAKMTADVRADNSSANITSISSKREKVVRLLKDMVVVSHSSGNLMFASALLHGGCELDSYSSKWISIQGPMRGTNTANQVLTHCQKPSGMWDNLVRSVLKDFELCPIQNSTRAMLLEDTPPASSKLNDLYDEASKVFRKRVNASMCGVSPFGIPSNASAKYVALAEFSNHSSSENDGVIVFESCRGGLNASLYQKTYRNRAQYYEASINHEDGRFVHGDSAWGEARKPVKWLQCQF